MAFYKQDIVDINLNTGNIHRSFLNHAIGYKNDDADRFGIRTFRDGVPQDLTGASCQAVFMAPNGSKIALTSYGTVSGNVAYVTLPPACYDYEGQFCLAIQLVGGGVTGTMRIVDGMVVNTGASGTVAPTSSVPTYQEIIAQYDAMVAATAAANGAIAATYSGSATYKVGDYCIHDGGLYRCTTAITTAEAWNAAHWTATKIGPDVSDLKSALSETNKIIDKTIDSYKTLQFVGGSITSGDVGDTITLDINTSSSLNHIVIPVDVGDSIILTGRGATGPRLWTLTDNSLKVVAVSPAGETRTNKYLFVEQKGYAIINAYSTDPSPEVKYRKIVNICETNLNTLESVGKMFDDSDIADYVNMFGHAKTGTYATNVDFGSVVSFTKASSDEMKCLILPCNVNDEFVITGNGGTNALLWAFTDTNRKLISKSQTRASETGKTISAPCKGYLVSNIYSNSSPTVYRKVVNAGNYQYRNYTFGYTMRSAISTPDTIGATISTLTPVTSDSAACCVIDVKAGDKIYHKGRGYDAYRAWCFIDDLNMIVDVAGSSVTVDTILIAPSDGKLILNCRETNGWFTAKKDILSVEQIINAMNGGYSRQFLAPKIPELYIPTNGSYGAISSIVNVTAPTVAELYGLYDSIMEQYPTYISKEELPNEDQSGTYKMYCYTFAPEQIPINSSSVLTFNFNPLPKVILGGGVHGNGNSGDDSSMIGTLYYFLRDLCANWETNETLKYLRWNVVFKVVPLQNPWGYQNMTRKNSRGVDINRNMPIGWIYSTETTTAGYGGSEPLSENESKNMKYVMDQNDDALIFFDIHSRMDRVQQSRMMYCGANDATPMVNVFRSSLPYINAEWRKIDPNLPATINGDITLNLNGVGNLYSYANSVGINGGLMEGFSDYQGNSGDPYNATVAELLLTYLGTTLLHSLRFFHDNYFPWGTRQIVN